MIEDGERSSDYVFSAQRIPADTMFAANGE